MILKGAKVLLTFVGFIIGTFLAFDAWMINRSETMVAKPLEAKIMATRKADMEHLNNRFDRIETLIIKTK